MVHRRYSVRGQAFFLWFLHFFGSCRNSVKTGVVERLVVFQHTVDRMQQLAHYGTQRLQWQLAVIQEVLEVGFDVWVMLFGAQGRHVESRTNMAVASLGDTRFLMDALAGIEGARIEARELHPLAVGKPLRQQKQLAHQRDGAGLGNALDAREQQEYAFQFGVFPDQYQRLFGQAGYALL